MIKQLLLIFIFINVSTASLVHAIKAELTPQSNSTNGVKVTVIPRNLFNSTSTWDFEVSLETHVRDLKEDMNKISTLVVDGKQYLPFSWEGSSPEGHHRKGTLHFKAFAPLPQRVELQIHLSGEKTTRNFSWILSTSPTL